MSTRWILVSLALAAGLALGVMINTDTQAPVDNTPQSSQQGVSVPATTANALLEREVADLRQLLQSETLARQQLAQQVVELSREVSALDPSQQVIDISAADEDIADIGDAHAAAGNSWFDQQALLDSGMSSSQAMELKSHFEKLELERLYLRDQSVREGWDRAQYREAIAALDDKEGDLKNQLSESAYDAYLYASGQANRVEITNVMASAQAGLAGVQAGDHILRYDNQRIYNGYELRESTTGGRVGDTIALEVERNGQVLLFYLPRGPLGIRMNSIRVAP